MKLVILLAVAACSGGSKAPQKPAGNPRGVIWETALEPWHVQYTGMSTAVDGNRATFGAPRGWVHQFDLATGKPLRERKLEMGSVTSVLTLSDGRVLVVGFASPELYSPPAAYVFDTNFEPKQIALPVRVVPKGSLIFPRAVLVPDGGVVITGAGLPLSIYDAKDLSVRSTLDQAIGWGKVSARGEVLFAERNNVIKRFDVSTNGQRDYGYILSSHLVSVEGGAVMRTLRGSKYGIEILRDDKTKKEIPDDEVTSVHDYDGKRFITTMKNELRIHEMPDGAIKKRIKVDDENAYLTGLTVAGKRAVVASRGVVRVIDLETGEVTPKASGAKQAGWLAIGDDGAVLLGDGSSLWSLTGGKVGPTEKVEDIEAMRTGDARRYVTAKRVEGGPSTFEIHTFGSTTVKTVTSETPIHTVWLAPDGTLLMSSDGDNKKQMLRAKGAKPEVLFSFNPESDVLAAEPLSDTMLVLDGRVAVVGQDGKLLSTIRIPHCAPIYAYGALEDYGPRAATWDPKDLAIWDRKTGKPIAVASIGGQQEVVFMPKRSELLVRFDDRLVVWSPNKGTRVLPWPGVNATALSDDGKKLAVTFLDGRAALYDLETLLAITPLQADFPAGEPVAETCGEADPLIPPPPEPEEPAVDDDVDDPPPPEEDE